MPTTDNEALSGKNGTISVIIDGERTELAEIKTLNATICKFDGLAQAKAKDEKVVYCPKSRRGSDAISTR